MVLIIWSIDSIEIHNKSYKKNIFFESDVIKWKKYYKKNTF